MSVIKDLQEFTLFAPVLHGPEEVVEIWAPKRVHHNCSANPCTYFFKLLFVYLLVSGCIYDLIRSCPFLIIFSYDGVLYCFHLCNTTFCTF